MRYSSKAPNVFARAKEIPSVLTIHSLVTPGRRIRSYQDRRRKNVVEGNVGIGWMREGEGWE